MKIKYLLLFCVFLLAKPAFAQLNPFVAEIRIFAGNFAPTGWAKCEGQLMSISQNTALFSLLGTFYGGDGKNTFALPDLRERVAIGIGQGPGLSNYDLGQTGGESSVILTPENLPIHNHTGTISVSSATGTTSVATQSTSLASPVQPFNGTTRTVLAHNTTSGNITNTSMTTSVAGTSTPLPIAQPYLVCNYIIALQGVFPQRP